MTRRNLGLSTHATLLPEFLMMLRSEDLTIRLLSAQSKSPLELMSVQVFRPIGKTCQLMRPCWSGPKYWVLVDCKVRGAFIIKLRWTYQSSFSINPSDLIAFTVASLAPLNVVGMYKSEAGFGALNTDVAIVGLLYLRMSISKSAPCELLMMTVPRAPREVGSDERYDAVNVTPVLETTYWVPDLRTAPVPLTTLFNVLPLKLSVIFCSVTFFPEGIQTVPLPLSGMVLT